MRLATSALCATVAVGMLAGCSGNGASTSSVPSAASADFRGGQGRLIPHWSKLASAIPESLRPAGSMPLHGRPAPLFMSTAGGIYVSEFYSTDIFAYTRGNTSNNPPTCTIPNVLYLNDVAADARGNVIDPDGGSRTIQVFGGSGQCGKQIGNISDPYGQPADASSMNVENGTIAVANIFSTYQGGGTITLCTLKGGCSTNLVNSNMYEVIAVAMARNGDCWADSYDASGKAWLTYFQGCAGTGQSATGFNNTYAGGLDIDKQGNLIAIDSYNNQVSVYSGCNPNCTLVSGPFTLNGEAIYGHLNRQSMSYATADFQYGQIDVYDYDLNHHSFKYMYSFNNGLTASDEVDGVAYAPRSHE
ncbi:MAG: hypothetical protein JOZ77_04910 [Candidatus Eremiobacteraeota bacterium]|nr:hypothetical protein [Candidatus Eremiobacteraeota bacterium]